MWKGFKQFLLRGNVVDLAVAVVIGAAFGGVVSSLVANLLMPLVAALFGQHDFSALTFEINHSVFRYGLFLNALVSFLTIAAAVYSFVVVPMRTLEERRRKRAPEEPAPVKPEEVRLLAQIRDLLERQAPLHQA